MTWVSEANLPPGSFPPTGGYPSVNPVANYITVPALGNAPVSVSDLSDPVSSALYGVDIRLNPLEEARLRFV